MKTGTQQLGIAFATLNGSGANGAKVGPLSAREVWHIEGVHVQSQATSITNESTCTISVGDANTKAFRDQTFTGSSGDATDMANGDMKVGEFVWADWVGGDAGASMVLIVTGTKDI